MKRFLFAAALVVLGAFPVSAQEVQDVEIFWASPLVPHRAIPDRWFPAILEVENASAVSMNLVWVTTTANRLKPWAVGAGVVSESQLTLLQGDNRIHVVRDAGFDSTFSTLAGPVRNRINTFCDDVGVARPLGSEVLRDLFNRLVGTIQPSRIKTIETLLVDAHAKQGGA